MITSHTHAYIYSQICDSHVLSNHQNRALTKTARSTSRRGLGGRSVSPLFSRFRPERRCWDASAPSLLTVVGAYFVIIGIFQMQFRAQNVGTCHQATDLPPEMISMSNHCFRLNQFAHSAFAFKPALQTAMHSNASCKAFRI